MNTNKYSYNIPTPNNNYKTTTNTINREHLSMKTNTISFTGKKEGEIEFNLFDKINKPARLLLLLICSCSSKASKVIDDFNKAFNQTKNTRQKLNTKKPEANNHTLSFNINALKELFNPENFIAHSSKLYKATINMMNHTYPSLNFKTINSIEDTNLFKRAIKMNLGTSKFAQILADDQDFINHIPAKYKNTVIEVLKKLLDSNTPTRTIAEAQAEFNNIFGKENIKIIKRLGTGTIAEIYEVKISGSICNSQSNWETAVVKIIKNNLTPEKLKDEEAFYKTFIEATISDEKLAWYYSTLVTNLYQGWLKEINLENEKNNAIQLAKNPDKSKYKIVKMIDVNDISPEDKKRVLVMEKVPGIPLNKLIEFLQDYNNVLKELKKEGITSTITLNLEAQKIIKTKHQKIISQYPWLLFTKRIQDSLSEAYLKAISSQFYHCEEVKNSDYKTIHGDPHSGNIFFNLDTNKMKPELTYIDTGLGITYNKKEHLDNLLIGCYTVLGDSKNLTKCLLKDAQLPPGANKSDLLDKITSDLDNELFGPNTEANITPSYQNKQISLILKRHRVISDRNTVLVVKAYIQAFQTYRTITKLTNTKIDNQRIFKEILTGLKSFLQSDPIYCYNKLIPSIKLLLNSYDSKVNLSKWLIN